MPRLPHPSETSPTLPGQPHLGGDILYLAGLTNKFVVHTAAGISGHATLSAAINAAPSVSGSAQAKTLIVLNADSTQELTITRNVTLRGPGRTIGGLTAIGNAQVEVQANVNGYLKAQDQAVIIGTGTVYQSPPSPGYACLLGINGGTVRHRGDVTLDTDFSECTGVYALGGTVEYEGTIRVLKKGTPAYSRPNIGFAANLVLRGRVESKDWGVRGFNGMLDCYASIDTRTTTNTTNGSPLHITQNASFGGNSGQHHTLHTGCELLGPAAMPSIYDGNPGVGATVQVAGSLVQASAPASTITLQYLTLQSTATGPGPTSGVVVRSGAVLAFDQDAEYQPILGGTFTVTTSTKATGKVVYAYLGAGATEPSLPAEFQNTGGAFVAGRENMYGFKVGANGKIQYAVTQLP